MKQKKLNKKVLRILLLVLTIMFASIGTVFAERIIASNKVTYSNSTSGLNSTNVQSAVDELYKKCASGGSTFNFAKFLQSMETSDTIIADDGTADHNMRYIGKVPNNYVRFSGELWQVIGVFNNIDNGSGNQESRVKIVKSESLGNKQWDTNNTNIWKNSTLKSDFQALSYASNNMVDNAIWYLGDAGGIFSYTSAQTYSHERETTVASGNDPTWTGKVGLMYLSDYGFASSACKDSYNLNFYSNSICINSNWIYLGLEWFISPSSRTTTHSRIVQSNGHVSDSLTNDLRAARPVVYLKSNVKCMNCNEASAGTQSNPFQIG